MELATPRRRLRLLALVIAVPVLAVAPWAYAATSAPEVPTITFTATGTAPVVCGSRPNVTNLVVQRGTKIIIANRTGVTATVDIGRSRVLTLADGSGALVRLRVGQHDLQMIPDCVVVSETNKAVVNVLTAAQMSALFTPTSTLGGLPGRTSGEQGVAADGESGSDEPDVAVAVEPTTDPESTIETALNSSTQGSPTSTVSRPGPTTEAAVAASVRTAPPALEADGDSPDVAVIEVDEIRLDGDPRDSKGLRLVGAIATICVFGVTAAIIRAIVSDRTTSSVG